MSLISNGIKRRAVYRFKCTGVCGKRKTTFVYERARDRVCLSCSKLSSPVQQESLFVDLNKLKEVSLPNDIRENGEQLTTSFAQAMVRSANELSGEVKHE